MTQHAGQDAGLAQQPLEALVRRRLPAVERAARVGIDARGSDPHQQLPALACAATSPPRSAPAWCRARAGGWKEIGGSAGPPGARRRGSSASPGAAGRRPTDRRAPVLRPPIVRPRLRCRARVWRDRRQAQLLQDAGATTRPIGWTWSSHSSVGIDSGSCFARFIDCRPEIDEADRFEPLGGNLDRRPVCARARR